MTHLLCLLLTILLPLQSFASSGNAEVGVGLGGFYVSGAANMGDSSGRGQWTNTQTSLTGGESVDVDVTDTLAIKGAKIAQEKDGVDGSNLTVNAGKLEYRDLNDNISNRSANVGVSASVGLDGGSGSDGGNANSSNTSSGGFDSVSVGYSDAEKEGITRATIGKGTITVGGVETDQGINRDIHNTQEITKDEATNTAINLPIELITDPKKYAEDVKNAPAKHLETIENLPENVKEKVSALKIWAESHGLTLGVSGEGKDLTVQIIVPEGMKDSEMPFDGEEFGVVQLSPEGDAALRKQLGLGKEGALTVIIGANGETEVVYGEGDAGTMAMNGFRLVAAGSGALPEVGAAVGTCIASVVCAVVVGSVIIAGVTYAVVTNTSPAGNKNTSGGSVLVKETEAQVPGIPTEDDGFIPPKNWDGKKVKNPNGSGSGYQDKKGNVWVPTGPGGSAHGGPHWDVQKPGGGYVNVYPGGRTRGGK